MIFRRSKKVKTDNTRRRPVVNYQKQPVYSYRSLRSRTEDPYNRGDQKPELPSKSSFLALKATRLTVLLIVLCGFFYVGLINPESEIRLKSEQGSFLREESAYSHGVNEIIAGNITYRNKILADNQQLAKDIKTKFPEINTISINTPALGHRPVVEISLLQPVARLVTTNDVYILDQEGTVLFKESEASNTVNTANLVTINDNSNHQVTTGKPGIALQHIQYIQHIRAQMENKNIRIENIILAPGGSGVNVKFHDASYLVKFSFYADARNSSGAYLAMREHIDKNNLNPKEYIDVRIPERAYIK